MKRFLSVFEMITRSSIYKVLIVIAMMAGMEIVLFYKEMGTQEGLLVRGLEGVVDDSGMIYVFAIAFFVVSVLLAMTGCNFGTQQGYTLKRLQISEQSVYAIQALYNFLAYVLVWAAQVMVILFCATRYLEQSTDVTTQTLVLAFIRNDHMNRILPIANGFGWFKLLIVIYGCAYATALIPFFQRRRDIKVIFISICEIGALFLFWGSNATELFLTLALLFYSAFTLTYMRNKGVAEYE